MLPRALLGSAAGPILELDRVIFNGLVVGEIELLFFCKVRLLLSFFRECSLDPIFIGLTSLSKELLRLSRCINELRIVLLFLAARLFRF